MFRKARPLLGYAIIFLGVALLAYFGLESSSIEQAAGPAASLLVLLAVLTVGFGSYVVDPTGEYSE